MDRNTVIGFVLLGVLFIAYLFVQTRFSQAEQIEQARLQDYLQRVEQARIADSLQAVRQAEENLLLSAIDSSTDISTLSEERRRFLLDSLQQAAAEQEVVVAEENQVREMGSLAAAATGEEQLFTLENDVLLVTLSSKGGKVKSVQLKDYKDYEGNPLMLVKGDDNRFGYSFFYDQDRRVNTEDLYFEGIPTEKGITFRMDAGAGRVMEQVYSLNDTAYMVDYTLQLTNFNQLIPANQYSYMIMNWDNSMQEQERNMDYER